MQELLRAKTPNAMNVRCLPSLLLGAWVCVNAARAQTVVVATQPDQTAAQTLPGTMNKMTVVLDAGHGGADNGALIGGSVQEKTVTLALALKLQALLTARGFTVVMTRTADSADRPSAAGTPITLDDRAGIANHARASACLLLHAAASGNGVHLYSSELDGVANEAAVLPWLTAQAAWVVESAHLERELAESLRHAGVARISGRASIRPVDSLTCPAVVVELAPESEDVRSVADTAYQQRVAQAIAAALEVWPTQTQPPNRIASIPAKPKPNAPATATPGGQP